MPKETLSERDRLLQVQYRAIDAVASGVQAIRMKRAAFSKDILNQDIEEAHNFPYNFDQVQKDTLLAHSRQDAALNYSAITELEDFVRAELKAQKRLMLLSIFVSTATLAVLLLVLQ